MSANQGRRGWRPEGIRTWTLEAVAAVAAARAQTGGGGGTSLPPVDTLPRLLTEAGQLGTPFIDAKLGRLWIFPPLGEARQVRGCRDERARPCVPPRGARTYGAGAPAARERRPAARAARPRSQ